jgi:cytochrome c551/c552
MKTFGLIPGVIAAVFLLVSAQAAIAAEMPASAQSAGCTACHKVDESSSVRPGATSARATTATWPTRES